MSVAGKGDAEQPPVTLSRGVRVTASVEPPAQLINSSRRAELVCPSGTYVLVTAGPCPSDLHVEEPTIMSTSSATFMPYLFTIALSSVA